MDFVHTSVGLPSVWDDLRRQIYLGKEEFVKDMQQYTMKAIADEFGVHYATVSQIVKKAENYGC